MTEYLLIFIAGITGSFHCIGMCGVFPVTLASVQNQNPSRKGLIQLLYNIGRICTYTFLGAVVGLVGHIITTDINPILSGQMIISFVAGVIMIMIGFQILGVIGETKLPGLVHLYNLLKKPMTFFLKQNNLTSPFFLGIFNGFLPCPLIYAFLFTATAFASPQKGALVMLCLGLGTIPAMFLLGNLSEILSPKLKGRISRIIPGAVVMIFGVITIARTFLPFGLEYTTAAIFG